MAGFLVSAGVYVDPGENALPTAQARRGKTRNHLAPSTVEPSGVLAPPLPDFPTPALPSRARRPRPLGLPQSPLHFPGPRFFVPEEWAPAPRPPRGPDRGHVTEPQEWRLTVSWLGGHEVPPRPGWRAREGQETMGRLFEFPDPGLAGVLTTNNVQPRRPPLPVGCLPFTAWVIPPALDPTDAALVWQGAAHQQPGPARPPRPGGMTGTALTVLPPTPGPVALHLIVGLETTAPQTRELGRAAEGLQSWTVLAVPPPLPQDQPQLPGRRPTRTGEVSLPPWHSCCTIVIVGPYQVTAAQVFVAGAVAAQVTVE